MNTSEVCGTSVALAIAKDEGPFYRLYPEDRITNFSCSSGSGVTLPLAQAGPTRRRAPARTTGSERRRAESGDQPATLSCQ